eukprot:830159-Prorocentrum_minimum.AAC.1
MGAGAEAWVRVRRYGCGCGGMGAGSEACLRVRRHGCGCGGMGAGAEARVRVRRYGCGCGGMGAGAEARVRVRRYRDGCGGTGAGAEVRVRVQRYGGGCGVLIVGAHAGSALLAAVTSSMYSCMVWLTLLRSSSENFFIPSSSCGAAQRIHTRDEKFHTRDEKFHTRTKGLVTRKMATSCGEERMSSATVRGQVRVGGGGTGHLEDGDGEGVVVRGGEDELRHREGGGEALGPKATRLQPHLLGHLRP